MKPKQMFNIFLTALFLIFGLNCENLLSAGGVFVYVEISEMTQDTTRSADQQSDVSGRISVTQKGSENTAKVRQSGGADGETRATVTMTGSGNTTELTFNGSRGDADLDIAGEDNLLLIRPTSVFEYFSIQFKKYIFETDDTKDSARDFMMIFRNLDNTLEIHQHTDGTIIHTEKN